MPDLTAEKVKNYLQGILGKPAKILNLTPLGKSDHEKTIKAYGYGTPIRIDYQTEGDQPQSLVLHTLSPGAFGHENMEDRAQVLLQEYRTFNRLPAHVQAVDVAAFGRAGRLLSLGEADELFLLTEYVEGEGYFLDLARLERGGELTELDLARVDALSSYLAAIHKVPVNNPGLYIRRIRELVGHGECIMGLTDSYPPNHPAATPQMLEEIEHLCVAWRWRLKSYTHRLRQVHGDFHPWNILFQSGTSFRLLDRSRGEYGDPADDVSSITVNYIFSSLQHTGRLESSFETLFQRFWTNYLEKSGDQEMLSVVAPFFAFRGLVTASPVWYPALPNDVRQKLLAFIRAVLQADQFDPARVNEYCGV